MINAHALRRLEAFASARYCVVDQARIEQALSRR